MYAQEAESVYTYMQSRAHLHMHTVEPVYTSMWIRAHLHINTK